MTDRGPLAGRVVRVQGADPGVHHGAWLLGLLGAAVQPAPCAAGAGGSLAIDEHHVAIDVARSPLVDWAESGTVLLTGLRDGPPLLPPGSGATAARGALLAFEVLSALAGQRVSIDGHRLLGEHAAAHGLRRQGPWSAGGAFRIMPASDGPIGLSLARPTDVELVPALVGADVVVEDPWDVVVRWVAGQRAEAAVAWAQTLGLAAAVVPGTHAADAAPFAVHRSGATGDRRDRPLVVDLSSLWAGPLCAHLLGLAGARVVKVETPARPDGARRGPPAFYDLLHGDHHPVALDFAEAADVDVLRRLLAAADVVIDSSRPRAMAQLGIDPLLVLAGGPGRTWLSITGYGRSSAWSDRVGFGDDTAAAAGLVAVDPQTATVVPCGDAIADPLAGVHAAVAALASTLGGGGDLIEVALRNVAAATLRDGSVTGCPDGAPAAAITHGGGPIAVERAGDGWALTGPEGPVAIAPATIRAAPSRAAPLGAHTDAVLAELGLR